MRWAATTRPRTSSTARSRRRGTSISVWRWSVRSRGCEAELARHPDADPTRVRIVDADAVVEMAESPAAALRRKPGASIRVAAELVAAGEAAALFSAGHTGATVMAAHGAFGMLPGVDRPALAATIPTRQRPAVLLDVGASVECRPQHLLQFAVMGSVYARVAFGIERAAGRRCCRSAKKRPRATS